MVYYLKQLMSTEEGWDSLILRLGLGAMILPHGLQKTMGLFGGHGFAGTMGFFTDSMGIPWIFAFLAIMAEFLGGIGLIAGFLTRIAAFGVGFTMLVAAIMVHLPNGFFMNWFGQQQGEGIEFHLLAVAIALAIILRGGGKFSIDHCMSKKCCER